MILDIIPPFLSILYNTLVLLSKNKTENNFSAALPHGKVFLLHRTKLVLHRPVSDGRHPIIFR